MHVKIAAAGLKWKGRGKAKLILLLSEVEIVTNFVRVIDKNEQILSFR
jgi:hypothetical protein